MNKKINSVLLKIYPKLFWYPNGEPKRCTDCFHDKFVETPTANLNGIVCESYFNCKKCGAFAQEWDMDTIIQITWSQHLGGIFGNN